MTEHDAAVVHGEPIPEARIEAFLKSAGWATSVRGAGLYQCAAPPRGATGHDEVAHTHRHTAAPPSDRRARDERQRRRWATQVVVTDELARRACAARGLEPPPEASPTLVAESDVADLGSIVATALAHSPAARTLLAELEREQPVPEEAAWEYYTRNRDRYLTPDALRRGVNPFHGATDADFVPYERARDGITAELRRAAGQRAFFDWLDRARAKVTYAPGHEHPGDPSHPDHEHRH
ncbi:peptidyl-prolyl cis-trans isomerase [Streptomyces sp. NBC_00663]|uniref:peptidyl-prolyl cis-trans isomerase n=1 Tax=Streptomyces sp. NBC_00663 TaxID=2975801 RepID=UPI002E2ECD96|nr:peptidyl-prolyl cis-trans isomerase [Streptomyces sp. NBC_00663]